MSWAPVPAHASIPSQAELIGHEKDGKRDEAKRAALHARWQEAQDEEAVQRLLRGIQHGFRSRRGPRGGGALYAEVRAQTRTAELASSVCGIGPAGGSAHEGVSRGRMSGSCSSLA